MRELIQVLCSPISQCLLVFIFSAYLRYAKRNKKWAVRLIWTACIWLFLCSQYFFSTLLLLPLEHRFPSYSIQSESLNKATQIFVLAGYYRTKTPLPEHTKWPDASYQRITNTLFLHQHLDIPVIISGGNFLHDPELNYATAVAQFLVQRGVQPSALTLVKEGTNTLEEMTAVAPLLSGQTTLVISSATHIPRLALNFQRIAPHADVLFFPVEYLSNSVWEFTLNTPATTSIERVERAIYEYLALINTYFNN